ncbi:MAG: V-type ATP synthase subunit E [bacterium]|nr:V-type ATP synthase subunit E [bacterium]
MEKVAKKILDDAKKEYDKIIKEAKDEAIKLKNKTKEELDRLNAEIEKQVKEVREKEKRRLVGMANLASRNELLHLKREIIDTLFNEALIRLNGGKKEEYLKLIKVLLERTGGKDGEIIVGESDDKIDSKFIENVNNKLGAKFILANEKRHFNGGFILHQGKVEIDASFEAILNTKRANIELELAKLLFQ